jgi:signal transduction histidine kinase
MSYILLVSPDPADIEGLITSLPTPPSIVGVPTVAEAYKRLLSQESKPFLILADTRGKPNLVDFCRQLCRPEVVSNIPVVVMIADPVEREMVLSGGADDYLLFPLLPMEVDTRLRLYRSYQRLVEECERSRQRNVQNERLVTVGRLAPGIVHGISNPMQAMRGALTLALEESHSPHDVEEYVRLTQQELERVVKLVNRMRQLYRPSTGQPETVNIPDMLRDAFELAHEETMRQKVKIQDDLSLDIPPLFAVSGQLHLAFLSIVLNLTDAIGAAGGGEVSVTAQGMKDVLRIEFSTTVPIAQTFDAEFGNETSFDAEREANAVFRLSPMTKTITASGGTVRYLKQDSRSVFRIELPR